MTTFKDVYLQFLDTITSCTYSEYTDEELENQLFNLLIKAITSFKFPRIPLTYQLEEIVDPDTGITTQTTNYIFVNEVTQKEISICLNYMRVEWLRYQLAKEEAFEHYYFDANAKTHSRGNLLAQLRSAIDSFHKDATQKESRYYRVTEDNKPAIDYEW